MTALQCAYLPIEALQHGARGSGQPLGAVGFFSAADATPLSASGPPLVRVPMPPLSVSDTAGSTCELWSATGNASHGERDDVQYGHNGDILFGAIQLAESAFAASAAATGKTPLQQAAEAAYAAIFRATAGLGFAHILRFWNYMADINGESHGIERYRQFNMGRQDGFLHSRRAVTGSAVPAASAVGFDEGPLTVYFLASRSVASTAIENPRQISAYQYPSEYGPRSPTFSRASVAHLQTGDVLFLSGTASIVGHRTLHAGDVIAQVRETVANIAAMVAEANRVASRTQFTLPELCCKVYVRHAKDVGAIHDELRRTLGDTARLLFLKADICRRDLLMEIEASAGHPLDFATGI